MKQHLVIIYHSFDDPIFKGLMLRYIQSYQQRNGVDNNAFHIITFEQKAYQISPKDTLNVKNQLKLSNIFWHPLQYHTDTNRLLLFKKLYDLTTAAKKSIELHIKWRFTNTMGFTTISGILAFFISKILRNRSVLLNIEPHSDYLVDFGQLNKASFKYKVLNRLEKLIITYANHVTVPTKNALSVWENKKTKGSIHFVPTCIDFSDFQYDSNVEPHIRKSLNLEDDVKIIIYVGKFDGIYYSINDATDIFNKIRLESTSKVFFYIITTDSVEKIKNILRNKGMVNYLVVEKIPYEELSRHISAADYGMLLIPSLPSQKYRCPIKTANYLACGIPYIITPNIGDDSDIALSEGIGVVLNKDTVVIADKKWEKEKLIKKGKEIRGIHLVTEYLESVL